jgi:hypothetical protein
LEDKLQLEILVLLIHVLHVSHLAALEGPTHYAREIVDNFFRTYTQINTKYIDPHNHKFSNLTVESRSEIAFVGKPRGLKVPNHQLYKYELSEGLAVYSKWRRDSLSDTFLHIVTSMFSK